MDTKTFHREMSQSNKKLVLIIASAVLFLVPLVWLAIAGTERLSDVAFDILLLFIAVRVIYATYSWHEDRFSRALGWIFAAALLGDALINVVQRHYSGVIATYLGWIFLIAAIISSIWLLLRRVTMTSEKASR